MPKAAAKAGGMTSDFCGLQSTGRVPLEMCWKANGLRPKNGRSYSELVTLHFSNTALFHEALGLFRDCCHCPSTTHYARSAACKAL